MGRFPGYCLLHGTEAQQRALCDRVAEDLGGQGVQDRWIVPFPAFRDINGLRTALQMRVHTIRSGLGQNPTRRKMEGKEIHH